ncbi:hypothetical protein BGZ57DRAFT_916017 [Hyaloscypha finlandica]|nr:hypothetical protein BGZ57DRAFT_916017 [Hyaloscypha finlandica]
MHNRTMSQAKETKSGFIANDTEIDNSNTPPPGERRFFVRTLTCLIFPPALAAYFIWTNVSYLQSESNTATNVDKPIHNGTYIWWSWFVIGALGLNLSNYSLAGVEAGMLRSDHFQVSESQLAWHTDKSWSTLGAWSIMFRAIANLRTGEKRMLSWPWIMLFGLSVLSWAFVLSGLTMATTAGFVAGHDSGVDVQGMNSTTMNLREPYPLLYQAFQRWGSGAPAQIPGVGAVYTAADSTKLTVSTANNLPADASESIFLAPQASEGPVTGSAWGLLLKYKCTSVHQLSDFTVLNRRVNSTSRAYVQDYNAEEDVTFYYTLEDGASISVMSQMSVRSGAVNRFAFAEIGINPGFDTLAYPNQHALSYSTPTADDSPKYGGLAEEDILEVILWQSNNDRITESPLPVANSIPGLEGEYVDLDKKKMSAIGVRCTSSSTTGNAQLDGLTNTYKGFHRADPDPIAFIGTPRLGIGTPFLLMHGNTTGLSPLLQLVVIYDLDSIVPWHEDLTKSEKFQYQLTSLNPNWFQPLMEAAHVPNRIGPDGEVTYYSKFATAEDLERAILEAYKQYAVQIMFGGQENVENQWNCPDLFTALSWAFLARADPGVPPIMISVVLSIWAVGCVGLGAAYGSRKRYAATFNGYSFSLYCRDKEINQDVIFRLDR